VKKSVTLRFRGKDTSPATSLFLRFSFPVDEAWNTLAFRADLEIPKNTNT
jgi:hypothetical protein